MKVQEELVRRKEKRMVQWSKAIKKNDEGLGVERRWKKDEEGFEWIGGVVWKQHPCEHGSRWQQQR